jgi:hypothetical protein
MKNPGQRGPRANWAVDFHISDALAWSRAVASAFTTVRSQLESESGRCAARRPAGVEPAAAAAQQPSAIANLMTKEEARKIAAGIAKLPLLLKRPQH